MQNDTFVKVGEASGLTGLCPQTLRKLADENKIRSYRTFSEQRMFNKDDLLKMCNVISASKEASKVQNKINYIYTRVSSKKQLDDLGRQYEYIKSRDVKYSSYTHIQDVASGINFKREGLRKILDSCLQKTIGELVIAHKDRLSRFGFELIKFIVDKSGGKLTIIDSEEHKSSEQELSEDLLSIVQVYACKAMGKRKYKPRKEKEG